MAHSTVALPDEDPRIDTMRHILNSDGTQVTVKAQADVHVRSVEIVETREPGCVFPAPAFVLRGDVLRYHGDFPNGVNEVSYPQPQVSQDASGSKRLVSCALPSVTFLHRLTPNEQVALCQLGLMLPGFEIPEIMRDNVYQMPLELDVRTLDTDKGPITSVSIHDQGLVETSTEEDGYQLLQYFPAPQVEADKVQEHGNDKAPVELEDMDQAAIVFDDDKQDSPAEALAVAANEAPQPPAEPGTDEADDELAGDVFGDGDDEERNRDLIADVFNRVVLDEGPSVNDVPERERAKADEPAAKRDDAKVTDDRRPVTDELEDDDLADSLDLEDSDDERRRKRERTRQATQQARREDARDAALADGTIDAGEQAEIDSIV